MERISKLKWFWKLYLKAQYLTVHSCSKLNFNDKTGFFVCRTWNGQGLVSQNFGNESVRPLGTTWWLARNQWAWPGLWLWLDWFRISYTGSSKIIPFFSLLCAMWNLSKCPVLMNSSRRYGIQRSTTTMLLAYIQTSQLDCPPGFVTKHPSETSRGTNSLPLLPFLSHLRT